MHDVFLLLSLAALSLFTIVAMIDGVYLHLWRYRLYARAEARGEHALHAARAVLFVPALVWVFTGDTSGLVLWLGLAAIAVDFVIQILDTRFEADSRSFQGGLPRGEMAVHVVAALSHFALIVTSLLARPAQAFAGSVPIDAGLAPFVRDAVVNVFLGGAVLMAVVHVGLLHPAIVRWVEERRRSPSAILGNVH